MDLVGLGQMLARFHFPSYLLTFASTPLQFARLDFPPVGAVDLFSVAFWVLLGSLWHLVGFWRREYRVG